MSEQFPRSDAEQRKFDKQATLDEALSEIPEEFRLVPLNELGQDPQHGWESVRKVNSRDNYSSGIAGYAENLGTLLNGHLKTAQRNEDGQILTAERLRELEDIADIDGQSGASHGAAIRQLKKYTTLGPVLEQFYPARLPQETRKVGRGVVSRVMSLFKR